MRVTVAGTALIVRFDQERRVLSSAVLGGGLGTAWSWLNITVPAGYARRDPAADLDTQARAHGLRSPVVGMLTAVDVRTHQLRRSGTATAIATVGVGHALAAAGRRPRAVAPVGTINLLVVVDAPLDDAALVGATQTAVEAKTQALADAGVRAANAGGWATGTATDSLCVAALTGGGVPFAGPVTGAGADLALAVHGAILAGARAGQRTAHGTGAQAEAGR